MQVWSFCFFYSSWLKTGSIEPTLILRKNTDRWSFTQSVCKTGAFLFPYILARLSLIVCNYLTRATGFLSYSTLYCEPSLCMASSLNTGFIQRITEAKRVKIFQLKKYTIKN